MAPRAIWKGSIKLAELSCPVAMYTAVSTSERIAFHTLNRKTGHRVHREYVDDETGKPVTADDQVKGYETGGGGYVVLEPEEIAKAVPHGDKILAVDTFVACGKLDDTYFDRPYYLLPASPAAEEAFALLREGMRQRGVAAIAHTVLFRRLRPVLIRAHRKGLIATVLNFDYEVRSAKDAFADIPSQKIEGEMLDLAKHIIAGKAGKFDPSTFDDRYEAALADLVKAKLEGKAIKPPKKLAATKPADLLAALRESAGTGGGKGPASGRTAKRAKRAPAPERKAG